MVSRPERPTPKPLPENAGCSFKGWGTTLYLDWSSVPLPGYRPALGGKEVNTHPGQLPHRWAKPNKRKPGLEGALTPLSRCLVTAQVTKHLCFSFQPTDRIFSEQLYVFPLDHYAAFAVLQSRIHEVWAWLLSPTMKTDLRYAASDCFDTFPFPGGSPNNRDVTLEGAGQALYDERAAVMRECQIGLTKLYNDLPVRLQELHLDMDRAVLDAYGWSDLHVPSWGEQDRGWGLEVIERLYALNAARSL